MASASDKGSGANSGPSNGGPRRIAEEVQQALVGCISGGGVGEEPRGDGLHALARKVGDQAQHIRGEAGALATIPEVGAQVGEILL